MSDKSKIPYYVTVTNITSTVQIPSNTKIKTERGEFEADQLRSGECGALWGKPANEPEHRWIRVQRAYFFSVRIR